jgi:hypothetical protein
VEFQTAHALAKETSMLSQSHEAEPVFRCHVSDGRSTKRRVCNSAGWHENAFRPAATITGTFDPWMCLWRPRRKKKTPGLKPG